MNSIILPVLNGYKDTMKCLQSIADTCALEYEVILVDDGSTDETTKLESSSPVDRLKVIRHPKNMGFAAACNTGLKVANGEWITIFNNDMIVTPFWDMALANFLNQKVRIYIQDVESHVAMVTATIIEPLGHGPARTHMSEKAFQREYLGDKLHKHITMDFRVFEKGGPWMFKREIFEIVGLFDERFAFGNYEDMDFFVRMALKGYCFGSIGTAYTFHKCHATLEREFKEYGGVQGLLYINSEKYWEKWGENGDDISFERIIVDKKYGNITADQI
jgi:GT2 family glycosyltransferase